MEMRATALEIESWYRQTTKPPRFAVKRGYLEPWHGFNKLRRCEYGSGKLVPDDKQQIQDVLVAKKNPLRRQSGVSNQVWGCCECHTRPQEPFPEVPTQLSSTVLEQGCLIPIEQHSEGVFWSVLVFCDYAVPRFWVDQVDPC